MQRKMGLATLITFSFLERTGKGRNGINLARWRSENSPTPIDAISENCCQNNAERGDGQQREAVGMGIVSENVVNCM